MTYLGEISSLKPLFFLQTLISVINTHFKSYPSLNSSLINNSLFRTRTNPVMYRIGHFNFEAGIMKAF